jgi:hypothetical protein
MDSRELEKESQFREGPGNLGMMRVGIRELGRLRRSDGWVSR